MSDIEDYITKDDLVDHLESLIQLVKTNNFEDHKLQDIYDSIEEFIHSNDIRSGSDGTLDPTLTKYLFRGWYLSNMFDNLQKGIPVNSEDSTCPMCMK